MQEIKFASDLFKLVKESEKTLTVRNGLREYTLGDVQFVTDPPDKHGRVSVMKGFITSIELRQFRYLTSYDAERAGYQTIGKLVGRLREIYPDINLNSEVAVVGFRRWQKWN